MILCNMHAHIMIFNRIYNIRVILVVSVIIYMLVPLGVLHAQQKTDSLYSDTFSLSDTWRVALIGAQVDNFDNLLSEQRYIVLTFISLLRVMLKQATTRHLSTYEYYLVREYIKIATLELLQKKLEDMTIQLGIDSLSDDKKEAWMKKINTKKEIRKIKKKIKRISQIKVIDIPFDNILNVQYVEQSKYTTIPFVSDIKKIASDLNAQQVFYFSFTIVSEYVIITVYSYNSILDKTVEVVKTTVDPSNIQDIQKSMSNLVQAAVLGYPIASLTIRAITISADGKEEVLNDASIILDGELAGFGEVQINNLWVGVHSVIVLYDEQQRTFTMSLEKGEKAMRTIIFNTGIAQVITVHTNPSNAKVYVNSEWVGNTPILLPRTLQTKQLEMRHDGYNTARISLTKETPSTVIVTLVPTNIISLEKRLKSSRKQFYTAFSIFAFSLVLPIVLNGFYKSETIALSAFKANPRITKEEFRKSSIRRDALYYSYIGTAVLSGALGIYAFVELSRYLKVANEYHER